MTAISSAKDRGFDDRLATIDRCQIALLREIGSQYGPGRLRLKGGMALRVGFGSMRMTKDMVFDRDPSLSLNSAKSGIKQSMLRAATLAGVRNAEVEVTKATETTIRVRLSGKAPSGVDLRFEVEVSGRSALRASDGRREMVVPPPSYGMAPFPIDCYTNETLAAMKVAAFMAPNRNVPRDLYDLHELIVAGIDPVELMATWPQDILESIRGGVYSKVELIPYAQARNELLPYLPEAIRVSLDEQTWLDNGLEVADAVERWSTTALAMKEAPGNRGTDSAPDNLGSILPPERDRG